MLSEIVKRSIEESVLCWLATVNNDGEPNVSPKEMFIHHGDGSVLIAEIASPKSIANIKENPKVCISFVHIFKQKGFKLVGEAKIVESSEPCFGLLLKTLRQNGGDAFPVNRIIEVAVEVCEPIVAPSYWLFPQTTEHSQIEVAMETYGVSPKA